MEDLVISPLFNLVLGKITSIAIEEIKMLWNVDDEVDRLSNTFSTIRAVLEDAEEQQVSSMAVKDWLRKLKDISYDADDVFDEFAAEASKAEREQVSENNKRKEVRTLFSCFCANNLVVKHEIGIKIKEICERLEKIENDRRFHLKTSSGRPLVERNVRPKTGSLVVESEVIGRGDDKKRIMNILMSEQSGGKNILVLPIIGMGGQGKTTLAQLVYNDKQIANHFEVRAWVCVSDNYDLSRITNEIIESTTKKQCESSAIEPMQRHLLEILSGKRFLIILDDVWNEDPDDWERLSHPFSGGSRGSKVIVTTRYEKIAQIMGTIPPHRLEHLSEGDSWSLFVGKAFGDEDCDAHGKLVDIGVKIVKKCGGLPLAIKSLGGILSTTRKTSVWKNVLESKIWELPESSKGILPAIRLSYHHLPTNLKQCFAYCSLFPNNVKFDKDELVKLWMAEGYIQPKAGMGIEEVGEEMFDELLARSFFSQHANDKTSYVMHTLIHGLAEFVSKEEYLRIEAGESIENPTNARHLSLVHLERTKPLKLDDLYGDSFKRIRTFLYGGTGVIQLSALFGKFNCLRVLSLKGSHFNEIPDSINNLKYLRYLDLSSNDIKRLPDSICGLYNLQTLVLNWCDKLTVLPNGTSNLINLRHLLLIGCSIICSPPRMGKLIQLQTLTKFIVGAEGIESEIGELRHLANLGGTIEISNLEKVSNKEVAEKAYLKHKKGLQEVMLRWKVAHDRLQDEEVLEGLEPHINLEKLTIVNYMGASLPSWLLRPEQIITFSSLVNISFINCKKCLLPSLGKLPSLKYLILDGMDRVEQLGSEFCRGEGFRAVEYLSMQTLVNLKEWFGEKGGGEYMPRLRKMEILNCPKLKCFPLHLSPVLSELTIEDCTQLVDELRFPSLEKLTLKNSNMALFKSLPRLTSLQKLFTQGNQPWSKITLPSTLTYLHISYDNDTKSLDVRNLKALQQLWISNCSKLTVFYPPANLTTLRVRGCPNLESLPTNLHELASLRILGLTSCAKQASLPKKGLPSSLQHLEIGACPILFERCKKDTGKDWPKIAHIPYLMISNETIWW